MQSSQAASQAKNTALPGQQIWNHGISSFIFGTNDTQEWSTNNVETSPAIQLALEQAHLTLMRSFFFDKSLADNHATTDAEINQRLKTIENSGMTCMGVLFNVYNDAFNKHVVSYAGSRCQIYEFGNEDDYNGVSIENYLKQWNNIIPQLRRLNPNARFVGPATYNYLGNHDFMRLFLEGVKKSGVLPDAITFHWYPCWNNTQAECLAKAGSVYDAVQSVQKMAHDILGKTVPVGVTEWNYDPGNPPPAYGDNADFITKFSTTALQAMIRAGTAFANQFDAASYGGYGRLDMFDVNTNQPKPQYYAIKTMIQTYRPASSSSTTQDSSSNNGSGPLISFGKPSYCFHNDGPGGPQAIVSGRYGDWSYWHAKQAVLPSWCAIQLDPGPKRVLLTWSSDYIFDYINNNGSGPQDYTIAVSSDSTNGSDGTWRTIVTVTGNHTRVREHLIDFSGQSWIKMTVTRVQPLSAQQDFSIDQINVYDVSSPVNLNDSIFFMGDSITAMSFNRFDENQPSFDTLVHTASSARFPAMVDGGIGGWDSAAAAQTIDTLLSLNPDMHYWFIGLGTNDVPGLVAPETFQKNLQSIINAVKAAGHVPILARIPYANRPAVPNQSELDQEVRALNTVIDQLTVSNGLIRGPDLYQVFQPHAKEYLLPDGIHPTPAGAIAINRAWFAATGSYFIK
ncbi:MAG TPA: GDSL-type esterase/lipase family protein [Ktedonobacteraceae bacterium]|nr:GDSL-type esterase/lipase family protein [Ktedonobacteraceae bacterium]